MGKLPYLSFQSRKCCNYVELTLGLQVLNASLKSDRFVARMLFMSTDAMSTMLRSGIIAASTERFFKSAPEYPFVIWTSSSISLGCIVTCLFPDCSFYSNRSINYLRPCPFGRGMYSFLTRRLLTASSRSSGLFVAPIISILASSPAKVFAPSNCTKNSVFIRRDPS